MFAEDVADALLLIANRDETRFVAIENVRGWSR